MSKKHHRRRSWPRTILLLIFVFAALTGVYHCLIRKPQIEPAPEAESSAQTLSSSEAETLSNAGERSKNFYTILISGVDDGNGGSDTNILVGFDAGSGAITCASIPRDTKARIDGSYHKINYAYNHGGMGVLADTVSDMLGIPVDFTVKVDLTGFVKLVDAIDGVNFEVPINMNYDDPVQDLHIHFKKGMQHLTGKEAMEVVRFRHNNDGSGYGSQDIGRMETQQNFLKAVARQTLTVSNLDKISDFAKIFNEYVDTDLTLGNLAWLGKEAISIGADNLSFATLPGEWKEPYIYLDPAETLSLVNSGLNPYTEDRTAADLNILEP